MNLPFTNVHAHVFTSACAPDRFLRILPIKFVRRLPRVVKGAIDSKAGIKIISGLSKIFAMRKNADKRSEIDKYVAFLDVGTEATQLQVFERAYQAGRDFDPSVRIVGLTLNMDYMDSEPSKRQMSFETQLEEVKDIKRYYPAAFFPFLGIDPRHKAGKDLVEWARPYFETGVVNKATGKTYPYFSGIKLYPALGFFPFDPRLEALYEYAEKRNIPVMTHCTRVGSQYIGAHIENLIPAVPPTITVERDGTNVKDKKREIIDKTYKGIVERIAAYRSRQWIKNSKYGDNDFSCDLFGHPENYIAVLEKFPNLKICLAHMGGSNEVINSTEGDLAKIRQVDPLSWFEHIQQMMQYYPNLYTDISYTLGDFNDINNKVFQNVTTFLEKLDAENKRLADRVLFGTDFFMTEQEKREAELYQQTQKNLTQWWDQIGRVNTQRYLMQPL